jgi:raffinose synthase
LLKKLVLPDGSILRACNPGRPTRDCLFADVGQDGTSALKIWNTNDREPRTRALTRGGVVGAFNVQGVAWNFDSHENEVVDPSPPTITAKVKPYDVETLRSHFGSFAVWSHRAGKLEILSDGQSDVGPSLGPHEWEVFTIEPIQPGENVQWAPIGLGDMINSGGAILQVGALEETVTTTNSTFGQDLSNGRWRQTTTAEVTARGPGRFLAYCQPAPSRVLIDWGAIPATSRVEFSHDQQSGLLELDLPAERNEATPHHITVVWDKEM